MHIMLTQPHVIVFDEPTNYLDRDSLGALSKAITEFEGGVVLVSHNSEFTKSICEEEWKVEQGQLKRSGAVLVDDDDTESPPLTKKDGSSIKGPKVKKLNRKQQKELERKRQLAKMKGLTLSEDEAEGGQTRFYKNFGSTN